MTQTSATENPSAINLLIQAIDAMERAAMPLAEPEARALRGMIEVVDMAFMTASMIADARDMKSVGRPFLMVAMKMAEVNKLLGQRSNSAAMRRLNLVGNAV